MYAAKRQESDVAFFQQAPTWRAASAYGQIHDNGLHRAPGAEKPRSIAQRLRAAVSSAARAARADPRNAASTAKPASAGIELCASDRLLAAPPLSSAAADSAGGAAGSSPIERVV
jgi:hypothetical protein